MRNVGSLSFDGFENPLCRACRGLVIMRGSMAEDLSTYCALVISAVAEGSSGEVVGRGRSPWKPRPSRPCLAGSWGFSPCLSSLLYLCRAGDGLLILFALIFRVGALDFEPAKSGVLLFFVFNWCLFVVFCAFYSFLKFSQ